MKVVQRAYSESAPNGVVVRQDPPEGERIPERGALLVSISLGSAFTDVPSVAGLASKDAQWDANGYGPWAVLLDGEFAGWGGYQAEPDGADLGLVLVPRFRGAGAAIAQRMLEIGFDELGLEVVLVALPLSRSRPERALSGWGFRPDGEVDYDGVVFRRFRLDRARWEELRARAAAASS